MRPTVGKCTTASTSSPSPPVSTTEPSPHLPWTTRSPGTKPRRSAPVDAGAEHLKALARVSRLLRDRAMCEKLRGANSADALYALLSGS